MEKIKDPECTLEDIGTCKGTACEKCGWYRPKAERLANDLKRNGLKMCEDGLMRLIPEDDD